ncbi:MAG: hypothetical protein MAGBODY4_01755 [Candidatus Marinimicrobia bacterium]|nr:hypothetical protein [Candidatus Neomarinimicrobiota bacterium]
MNCYEYESHLSAFVDGDLPSRLRKEFLQHKSDCSDCEETYRDFKKTVSALHSLKQKRVSPDFNKRLYALIQEENQAGVWQKFQLALPDMRLPRYVVATAVVALIAVVSYNSITDNSPANQPIQKSVIPPPSLNIQQPVVAVNEAQSETDMVTESDLQDTNQFVPPKNTRSYEDQIKYVNSD